jgi:gamma-glutamylcyclotransferase
MYYFAYGTTLSRKEMAAVCPGAKPVTTVVLPNFKLIFSGWARQWRGGLATIRQFQGEKVKGALYEIQESDLRLLDKHEGSPAVYNRIKVMVFNEEGERLEAVTYIRATQAEEAPPSLEYAAMIRQGYRDWSIE